MTAIGNGGADVQEAEAVSDRTKELLDLVRRVAAIIDLGGASDEKVTEARMVLGAEVKLWKE